MHVQLWPVGGTRVHGLVTSNLLWGLMGLSWICLPNFSTFYYGVLWAAIDSHGRKIIIGKRTITMVVSQLRCLTPKNTLFVYLYICLWNRTCLNSNEIILQSLRVWTSYRHSRQSRDHTHLPPGGVSVNMVLLVECLLTWCSSWWSVC